MEQHRLTLLYELIELFFADVANATESAIISEETSVSVSGPFSSPEAYTAHR
jgi:hypothetical protein